jgi:hypothetical protein
MTSVHDVQPFRPAALYYQDADALEYLRVDEPVVYRRIDDLLTLILGLEDRNPVGFKIKGFRNLYLRKLKPSFGDDRQHFLRMVTVLERLMTELGESVFDEAPRREAYKMAANIAMEDQVIICDLPEAA